MIADRWGVSPSEVERHYPCDDLVPIPAAELWRGVTVQATPHQTWPWVAQIRCAPDSYDWIDNLGRRSPPHLLGLPDPAPGDHFTTAFGGRRFGRIVSTTPGEDLTAVIMGAFMSYVLVADGPTTRLLLKVVTKRGRLLAPMLSIGDLVMARRQLKNLARLAERSAHAAGGTRRRAR